MLLTILFLVVGIIGLVFSIIKYKKTCNDNWVGLEVLNATFILTSIIMSIVIMDNRYQRKVELEEYRNLKEQVNYVDKDYIVTDANLRNQVLEMNNKISKNKVYGHNIWVSGFYNPELGDSEKLIWKYE